MSTSAQPLPARPPAADADRRAATREAWKNVAGYVAAAVGAVAVAAATLHLWHLRLNVPLYDAGDNLMAQMFVQNILETGWVLDNPRLGAPGAMDLRDYPIPDVFHVALIKVLGLASRNSAVVLNLHYLMAFPLTALSAYFVLRRLRLGRLAALTPAVLYACMPYHFIRLTGHIFLTAYYLVPLMIWVILRVYLGRNPFLRADPADGRPRWRLGSWEAAGAALLCVLVGLGGVYYAFFSCFLLLMAGVRVAFRERRWKPLAAAALPVLLVTASLAAALAPSLLHQARYGKNHEASDRSPVEADYYGLNISEMLLPIEGHRLPILAALRAKYLAPPRRPTGAAFCVALGALASLGFIYLIGRFLWRRRGPVERADDGLAYLNFSAVLLGTLGGLGSLFAFYITPMIRCYERLSIFIAFFALAGLFLLVQRLLGRFVKGRWTAAAYGAGLLGLLALGAYDQTSAHSMPPYGATWKLVESDADFGRRIEAALPPGSMVYEMPYVPFPEYPPVQNLTDYELLRPFFHTRTLRFSYGAMKGREVSRWQADVASRPLPDALERLAFAGFSGVYLDRAGFADSGAAAEAELSRLLGVQPLVSLNGRQSFFDATAYVREFRARFTDAAWEAKKESVLHPVDLRWKSGEAFAVPGRTADDPKDAKWFGSRDQLHVHNYLNRPRRVVLRMQCAGWQAAPAVLRVESDLTHRELTLTPEPQPLELDLLVPPGDHDLFFSCDGPRMPAPGDPREIIYQMEKFEGDIGD